ncbi:TonB-dependent receptor domain-containing protein [Chitinophaga rhizophila]|uniref:TonB-dependent receptor n=1 Tax=Chitinophaga rhizophila TaxID=2866212 RepID=A0ABS7G6E6_9BACT|nr:TonB-dependent receptor [Chitinophaga rhizophila]MBW8683223.1 TonB-dependent receptor [Chitinophaga rhizophila]
MKTILYIIALSLPPFFTNAQQQPPADTMKVKQLKDVVVTARTPQVERKADRIVYNVQNSILASGSTVWETLRRAPGVQTNDNGQVTANNKSMTIYIDGKPVQMTGENLSAYLSGLPADNISRIEVMPVPPARYDAQGGGIINIITKKSGKQGFNGTASAAYTQATLPAYMASTTFNYRQDKLNIYGNYGYSDRSVRRLIDGYTIYETPASYADWRNNRIINPQTNTHSYQLGADYNINHNQVLGVRMTGFNSGRSTSARIGTTVYNDYRSVADSLLLTGNRAKGATDNFSFNLNYKLNLDSAGTSMNIDVDYVPYKNTAEQYVNTTTHLPDGKYNNNFAILTPSSQRINIWSGKIDLTYKAFKKWNMESGVKYNSISSDNSFLYYDVLSKPTFDAERSNQFRYTENTAAAYTSINSTLGKWSLQAGLRTEYTRTTGNSITLDSINKKNYLRLFPTLFVNYKLSDDHSFGLNYSSRIERPGYMQLNPARVYNSPYSYQQGNPALQPAVFTSGELSYTYKQQYTFSAGFNQMKGLMSNVTVQDNTSKTFYDTQQNLDVIREYSLQVMANVNPTSWWQVTATLWGAYRKQHSMFIDGYFASGNFVADFSTTHAFDISKKWGLKAELNARYQSPVYQGVLHVAHTSDVSIGISKSVLNKQGTIRLAFADIFYDNPYQLDIAYQRQRNGMHIKNDTRNVALSFSYKFGKNITPVRKRQTASEEERRRAN